MKICDSARATEETGVSSEMAPTEIGVLWRWFRIRTGQSNSVMEINILVEVFRGSEGRTAFVKKSKRGSAAAAEVGGSILVNVCNMVVSKGNCWGRSGRGHCLSNLNPQINHGPCILCLSLHFPGSV